MLTCVPRQILEYKDDFESLLQLMIDCCKSERGYTTSARVLAITLMTLTNTWVRDYRSVNPAEWRSDGAFLPASQRISQNSSLTGNLRAEFKRSSHTSWGRLYEVKDVKIEWHVATAAEIDFTLELLKDLVVPALSRLKSLLAEAREAKEMLSFEWVNDFCRVHPACLLRLTGPTC